VRTHYASGDSNLMHTRRIELFSPLALPPLMRLPANDRPMASKRFLFCATGSALAGHRRTILQYQCLNGSFESLIEIKSIEEHP